MAEEDDDGGDYMREASHVKKMVSIFHSLKLNLGPRDGKLYNMPLQLAYDSVIYCRVITCRNV